MPELTPIGVARTPYGDRDQCPRQPVPDGPLCRLEIDEPFRAGLLGVDALDEIEVLLWLDGADRDRLRVVPRSRPDQGETGVFALRSPHRPNPIGVSRVPVVRVEEATVVVRGLDAVDGTPLLDLKHAR